MQARILPEEVVLYESIVHQRKPAEEFQHRSNAGRRHEGRGEGRLYGYNEILYSCETYQFKDYSRYDMNLFDEKQRREHRDTQFPIDLQKAHDLGVRLTEMAKQDAE